MHLAQRLLMVLATAVILAFFSELFFMNEGPAGDLLARLGGNPAALPLWGLELALWYAFPAYLFLTAVAHFRARGAAALFLAGALYGWAVEGIVVWQMYEALPFTISWTPLGWHALVDVLLGWVLVRRVLQRDNFAQTAVLAAALGLFWGLWASWNGESAPDATAFAALAFAGGGLWAAAALALDRWGGADFRPGRGELVGLGLAGAALFAVQILPVFPLALLVLPPLLLLTGLLLQRGRAGETRPSILAAFPQRPRLRNYALLLLTPLAAALTYPAVDPAGLALLHELLPPLLMAAGFAAYGASAVVLLRRQPP